jgi:hypothetical protein
LVGVLNGPLPDGYSRSSLAADLMGRSGSSLIATFDTMGGSFDAFIAQAKRMGVVLTEEDVKAADEFGDSLTVLETQLGAVANKMALQFAPEMTGGMKAIGEEVARSKDIIVAAGKTIGETLAALTGGFRQAAFAARLFYGIGAGLPAGAAGQAAVLAGMGPGAVPGAPSTPDASNAAGAVVSETVAKQTTEGIKKLQTALERGAKESARRMEQIRRDDLRAEEAAMRAKEKVWEDATRKQVAANKEVQREIEEARRDSERLDREASDRRADASDAVTNLIANEISLLAEENQHFRQANDLIRAAEILGAIDARTAALARQLVVARDLSEQIGKVMPVGPTGDIPQAPGQAAGPWVDPKSVGAPPSGPWTDFGDVVAGVSEKIAGAVGTTGATVTNVFNGIADAVYGTVAAFGGLAGVVKNLGEFTKAVVRNIAVMAGINALWEAAQGVAALALSFFWPTMAVKAKLHFQAAALSGGVAAGGNSLGGSPDAGAREDNRTRYMREQAEKDRNTQREDRRSEGTVVQLIVDGRELGRAVLNHVRDGGDLRDGFRSSLGVNT